MIKMDGSGAQLFRAVSFVYADGTAPHVIIVQHEDQVELTKLARGRGFDVNALINAHFDVLSPSGEVLQCLTARAGGGIQRFFVTVPPADATPAAQPTRCNLQPATVAVLQGLNQFPNLNGREIVVLWRTLGEAGQERWAVRLNQFPNQSQPATAGTASFTVRPECLVPLREHIASREAALAVEARELLGATAAADASSGGAMSFGSYDVPVEVAVLHLLPLLSRCSFIGIDPNEHDALDTHHNVAHESPRVERGELEAVSEVCQQWRGACLATRALHPACARDVAVKLRLKQVTRSNLNVQSPPRRPPTRRHAARQPAATPPANPPPRRHATCRIACHAICHTIYHAICHTASRAVRRATRRATRHAACSHRSRHTQHRHQLAHRIAVSGAPEGGG